MHDIIANVQSIKQRIEQAAARVGRSPDEIQLVAVSKYQPVEAMKMAQGAGIKSFGENKAQELRDKVPAFDDTEWHFIGTLQTNKIKYVVPAANLIHSVDRLALAQELDRAAEKHRRIQNILLQVNVSGEASKHGIRPEELPDFVQKIGQLRWLKIKGLMTMAPLDAGQEVSRQVFRGLKEIANTLIQRFPDVSMHVLSMGMTNDFEIAIEEGSTLVRVGTGIFGQRDFGIVRR